ncbi:hypothetical protein ACIPSJ_01360 [Streptomyces sp. NPDC090088]|uniref:hypothetical protein n=1 Tax=Streptomyces sp. NPDC090088 TaxID=3365944 RepID=UPI0038297DD8
MNASVSVLSAEDQGWVHDLVMLRLPERITVEARTGQDCLWCLAPLDTTGIDLEPGVTRFRSCAVCYLTRLAWAITWRDWHTHILACDTCQRGENCMTARGRRAQNEKACAALGETLSCTAGCLLPIDSSDQAVAVVWDGLTHSYPGYAHTACFPAEVPR